MDPELDDLELGGAKPSRMPLIIAAVVALIVGGGIGAGAMATLGGDSSEAREVAEEAPLSMDGERKAGASRDSMPHAAVQVVNLGAFPVNLRGAGGGRVLRIEVQAQVAQVHAPLLAEKGDYRAAAQDAILMLASDYTYSELEGIEGKTMLRDELLGRLNSVVAPADVRIERIYFTQFVVQ